MKKYLITLLLLTGVIFQTQLFSYSGNIIGDTKCSEINETTRYSNLSPSIIEKIDAIGDGINQKYEEKDNLYKEKLYNLFEKVLNEHLQKTTYSGVQKEVLLRIGDYFVCKKEGLNIQKVFEISNVEISNITDHSIKVTWEGNNEVQTWLYVKKTGSIGIKHDASNNVYEYLQLGSDHEFTLFVQAKGSDIIKEVDFKTLSNNTNSEDTIINSENTEDTTNITTENTTNTSENKYLEEVNLPKCDTNNPEVQFIKTNDDWKHINDTNKRIFCVSPGDYRSLGSINITTSGTKDKRRYIVLNNGNDLHPGKLSEEQIARYSLTINNADFWTIDRAATIGYLKHSIRIKSSEHTIINRFFAQNHGYTILIDTGSHYTTIQNSRWDTLVAGSDAVGANIVGWGSSLTDSNGNKHYSVLHTKIIRNEFVDQNDGFQATVYAINYGDGPWQYGNVGGVIVNDNDFYLRENHVYRENGTDTKMGSPNPKLPLDENNPTIDCIISENRFWGYKNGPNGRSEGATIASMYSPGRKIYKNIYYDCDEAMSGGGNRLATGMSQGYVNSEIYENIIYKSGLDRGDSNTDKGQSMIQHNTRNVNIHDNYFVEPNVKRLAKFGDCREKSVFMNNKVIDPFNGEWEIFERNDHGNDTTFSNSILSTYEMSRNGFKDYVFTKDKFTNNPQTIKWSRILDPNANILSPIK